LKEKKVRWKKELVKKGWRTNFETYMAFLTFVVLGGGGSIGLSIWIGTSDMSREKLIEVLPAAAALMAVSILCIPGFFYSKDIMAKPFVIEFGEIRRRYPYFNSSGTPIGCRENDFMSTRLFLELVKHLEKRGLVEDYSKRWERVRIAGMNAEVRSGAGPGSDATLNKVFVSIILAKKHKFSGTVPDDLLFTADQVEGFFTTFLGRRRPRTIPRRNPLRLS